jgi:hypothetical protein
MAIATVRWCTLSTSAHRRIGRDRPVVGEAATSSRAANERGLMVRRGAGGGATVSRLRPLVVAWWPHKVSVAGCTGAVDAEVQPSLGKAQVPVEAARHRDRWHVALTIVGPVTDRAGGAPCSVPAAGTPWHCLLTHACNPFTSKGVPTVASNDRITGTACFEVTKAGANDDSITAHLSCTTTRAMVTHPGRSQEGLPVRGD